MISVIVCTHNRARTLEQALGSLTRLTPPGSEAWELVLVDNNSSDETAQCIQRFAAAAPFAVRCVFERETGLSFARNSGIAQARGDFLVFTDDDVTFDSAWLGELRQTFDRFDCLGVGGRIIPVWRCPKPRWLATEGTGKFMAAILSFELGPASRQIDIAPFGANMAFRRQAFEKYGLFRTDLGRIGARLMTGEDTEFGNRLLSHGERIAYSPGAVVFHPVVEQRTNKAYLEHWYFNYGRSLALAEGFPRGAVRYFGVPRYLFRDALSNFGRWMVTFDPPRRFRRRLHLCLRLGQITEARRLFDRQKS